MGYRYIGSKARLQESIVSEIKSLIGSSGTVIDLMSGTGAISESLKIMGYSVISNDVMTYSYHHSVVNLQISVIPEFEQLKTYIDSNDKIFMNHTNYIRLLSILNNLHPFEGYFFKEYSEGGSPKNYSNSRLYFSKENGMKIDAIRTEIERFRQNCLISESEYSLLIHDLIMAVNDIANIAGTYGHHLSKLTGRSKDAIYLKSTNFSFHNSGKQHKVYNSYAEEISSLLEGDLCYIDPPYMKRQYAANYHILETLARGDSPEAIGVSGLRPWRDQYSNFCSKLKIFDSFEKILGKLKSRFILISYSEDGLIDIETLVDFLNKFGKVSVKSIDYVRFKSNNSLLNKDITEYLILIEKLTSVQSQHDEDSKLLYKAYH